jgi:hypothetical protein
MNKWMLYKQMVSNMGIRYVSYRTIYELQRKSGILKRKFPVVPKPVENIGLSEWRKNAQSFFFQSRETLFFEKKPDKSLKNDFENILKGKIQFFSSQYFDLGLDYDWVTNPDTSFKYDVRKHWTAINDYSQDSGDIKYVWEKSRFSFLYTLIRYDYHFDEDHSTFVFQQITDWIAKNPLNCGPNYKCSQEISLRILNWIFALYFYKNASALTESIFQKMMQSIYWQLHHVYHNIHFSRITVRNNHALTETLALYVVSMLFPQFPNASKWKKKGKHWFEKEVEYQLYDDGSFLQFSMNYHRVVIQLFTWAIKIAELNKEKYKPVVYEKACKSLNFLFQCQEDSNGYLPNYGSNDGALFFRLSANDYRDYRPQLNALHILLTGKSLYEEKYEDAFWYGEKLNLNFEPIKKQLGISKFEAGGYYLIREKDTLTFVRCGKHSDRPAHADNLHIDIWYKGENVLLDGGTYKYNTDADKLKYFMGTASHNTVMLDNQDQMLKGSRFIWYYWSQAISAQLEEKEAYYEFRGKVSCFRHLSKPIVHERIIRKFKNTPEWEVTDEMYNKPYNLEIKQLWHTQTFGVEFQSDGEKSLVKGLFSEYYGTMEEIIQMECKTTKPSIKTKIQLK